MPKHNDPKPDLLDAHGALHPHPEHVADPLFEQSEFFDPRDLVQVRYEMLRRVQGEGLSVSETAARFGVSRPTYYRVQSDFEKGGLPALIPNKRGPKQGHKLTDAILAELSTLLQQDGALPTEALVAHVEQRHGLRVHPRTLERALDRQKKRQRRR